MKQKTLLTIATILCCFLLPGQPSVKMVKVSVTPDSRNWAYETGENVRFHVSVTQNGIPLQNVSARYELSYDMMNPFKQDEIVLKEGTVEIDGGTMEKSGFLRCRFFVNYNAIEYEGRGTAAFSPKMLQPTTKMPDDFMDFWRNAIEGNDSIPVDPKVMLLSEYCTDKTNVYELSIQNYRYNSRIYGILCVPKSPGKYPAVLQVPGAGVRPYFPDIEYADKGIIILTIGIHGIPVTMNSKIYDDLRNTALFQYQKSNWDSRDNVYYKRVYLGCVRAVDYIFSMNEFDGKNIVVMGGSQGGALAITTAALDNRIKGAVSFYPALSDLTGYLHNRAGGWPHLFLTKDENACIMEEKVKNTRYYDIVNFARLLKVPIYMGFGYNDMVCPPTTTFSVFNVISSPKTLNVIPEIEHFAYPEMWHDAWIWILNTLNH